MNELERLNALETFKRAWLAMGDEDKARAGAFIDDQTRAMNSKTRIKAERAEFIRQSPNEEPLKLARAMREAGLYSHATGIGDIAGFIIRQRKRDAKATTGVDEGKPGVPVREWLRRV